MVRLLNVNIPDDKPIVVSLTYIYGIGKSRAEKICKLAGINPDTRVINNESLESIRNVLNEEEYLLEGDLRRQVAVNISNLINIGTYRGLRHLKRLPGRGQRTRNNSKTARKLRKIVK